MILCLCSTGGSTWFSDLGDLVARSDNLLSLSIFGELDILVLPLCTLPDLHLTPTANDANTHRAEQIVSSVAVHVDTAVEHGRGIFADTAVDHGPSSRVVLDEVGDIVDDTGNGHKSSAVLGLILEVVPLHDGQGVERHAPVELGALLVELLLLLLDTTLFDFIAAELLQVIGEAKLLPHPDGPFGGIILMPFNGVAVVGRELVMEVVVAFTEGDECGDHMVTG